MNKTKKRAKKASAIALLARLGLHVETDDSADRQTAALFAIKQALWPSQLGYGAGGGSINPGPPTPNPLSGTQPQQAQPLVPPDQPSAQPAQQAQQPPPQQPGTEQPSPLFSVPHPPSDTANWLHMVQSPFVPDAASGGGAGAPESQKMARAELRAAFRAGRHDWLVKLASFPSRSLRLPKLLVKAAQPGLGYQQGGFMAGQGGYGAGQFGGGGAGQPGGSPFDPAL